MIRPDGFSLTLSFADDGEIFIGIEIKTAEPHDVALLTEDEAQHLVTLLQETVNRTAIIREMTTMFPEQRDYILENIVFRWGGGFIGEGT